MQDVYADAVRAAAIETLLSASVFPSDVALLGRADLRARAAGRRAAGPTIDPKEAPMTEHQTLTVRLHPNDNVVTARIDLLPEHRGRRRGRRLRRAHPGRPQGRDAADQAGRAGRKYDQIIGFASEDIAPGEHVHVHNVEMRDFDRDYAFGADVRPTAYVPGERARELRRLPARRTARRARATSSACSRP